MRTILAAAIGVLIVAPQSLMAQEVAQAHLATEPSRDCESHIISYAEWASKPDTLWTLTVDPEGSGSLYYFGAEHSDDPRDPQFAAIESAFEAFVPTVVFYEGPERPLGQGKEETIRRYGESGFVRYLAAQAGAEVRRLEPSPAGEMQYVLQSFSAEEAMLFFVLREAARLRDRKGLGEEELRDAIETLLERASQLMDTPIKTLDDLAEAYGRHWNVPEAWWQAPSSWFDPLADGQETGGGFTHDVNRASSHFRNVHMARVLSDAVLEGERVFAVVGRNHVPLQSPAIRCSVGVR